MFNNNKIKELEKKIKELESLVEYQNGLIEESGQLCEKLVKLLQDEKFKISVQLDKAKNLSRRSERKEERLIVQRDTVAMIVNRVAENNFHSKG